MKILELFAGSRSFGRVAEERGHEVFSIDLTDFDGIDLIQDIEFLTPEMIPFTPDVIWASPICTTYSIAAISHHRDQTKPKSDFAKKSDRVVENMWQIIDHYKCSYFVENPRGMFRKMPFVKSRPRATVSYCSYGDMRMKPTDIFTNRLDIWNPKPICKNFKYDEAGEVIDRHCHHQIARRGMPTGTQGLKNNFERSKIPERLMLEIIKASENYSMGIRRGLYSYE
jgi:hypothetical protein